MLTTVYSLVKGRELRRMRLMRDCVCVKTLADQEEGVLGEKSGEF